MKIGIGATTYKRPKHLELFISQIEKYTKDYVFYVANDSEERKGVAFRKNECIYNLRDCDYIFLFDDDCFPIKDGWVEFFIEEHKRTGENHFLYLLETSSIRKTKDENGISEFNNCGGCFIFITKKVIEEVGCFGLEYGLYGFEHAGYSQRIYMAGLNTHPYICPNKASEYLYSLDFQNTIDFGIEHKPSMDFGEAAQSIEKNRKVFAEDLKVINNRESFEKLYTSIQ